MSVFNQDFQKQKESISLKQLEKINNGVNRIRYIENKIINKGNLIISLLSDRLQKTDIKQQKYKAFITTNFKSIIDRRPQYQIRDTCAIKSKQARQEDNLQRVKQIKHERRQIKSVLAKRNEKILIQKACKRKKLLKEKELGKFKVNSLMQNRLKSIKQYKQKKEFEKQKYLGQKNNQKYFQDYETKLILSQKIKQFILLKYRGKAQEKQINNNQ